MSTGAPWGPEEYQALREIAADRRLTAMQIMRLLNARFGHDRSRPAILGAARRIGVRIGVARGDVAPPAPEPVSRPPPPYAITDLTPRHCRWIDGNPRAERPFACGREALPGKPYCAGHFRRAFGPAKKSTPVIRRPLLAAQ